MARTWWVTETLLRNSVSQFLQGDGETGQAAQGSSPSFLLMNLGVNIWSWSFNEGWVVRDHLLIRKYWDAGIFDCETLSTNGGGAGEEISATYSDLPELGTPCPQMPITEYSV